MMTGRGLCSREGGAKSQNDHEKPRGGGQPRSRNNYVIVGVGGGGGPSAAGDFLCFGTICGVFTLRKPYSEV